MGTLHHHHPHVPALPMAFNENSEKSSNPNVINAASTGNSSNCSSSADFSSADWSDRIHSLVGRCYRRWAQFVVMHPVKIILFCFVLTGICAMNMVKTKHRNSIRGYTPYGARALHEFDVRDEFFGQTGVGIRFFVLVLPKMGSNLLDKEMLKETVEVDTLIQNNLTIYNHIHQRNESFSQYCNRFCLLNEPVTAFSNAWADQQDQMAKGAPPTDRIRLDYPFSNIMGREVNIQPNLFGVHLANHNTSHGRNRTASFTNMESVEMIVLLYRAERVGGWTDEDISQYEMGVSDYFKNHFVGRHIRVLTISTSYASVEVDRSGNILRSRIGIGLAIMILCSMLTTSLSAFFMRQFSIYKLPVALFACLCPFMASGTALGLLFFFGVRNSSILGLTPFLILAIGIDDAFLMIHSWQLASSRRRKLTLTGPGAQQQKSSDDIDRTVADQLAEVLEDTGPAILISALTNILADVVGSFTGSPEITLLCMGNIASIIVDFFYQITLFTAVLVICARFELRAEQRQKQPSQKQQKQQQWHSKVAPLEDKSKAQHSGKVEDGPVAPPSSSFSSSAFRSVGIRRSLESGFKQFTSLYVRFVSNIFASILICFLWVAFLLVCMNAMLRFEINLTTKKLFPPDSPLLEIENFREDKVLPQYTTAQLFVNNPGDLTNDTRRRHLDELIEEMEHLQFAYPPESSFYFVRTFEAFQRENEENYLGEEEEEAEQKTNLTSIGHKRHGKSSFNLDDLESFLDWTEYKHWRGLLNFHTENDTRTGESHVVLDSFMATVAYHGEQLKDWYSRARVLSSWRRVVDKYSEEFNVTVLHDDGLYLDLLENMPTDIWQSGLGTLLCMAAICALFMNNLFVVVVTTGVIASIFVETLGLMSMMGLTMDPVVMAAVVISMGFSVDIPAHVSYHFHMAKWTRDPQGRKRPRSVEHRVRKAFASVGFPALQASTCTNICILTLLLVPLWMSQVFVHVLCTCLTLCTIHSLVLLPALFTLVASIDQQFCQRTDAESENKSGGKRPSVRI